MIRKLCSLFLSGLLMLAVSACASLQYSAEPIEAWVVDAETNQPIEGVIVVAHWALESTSRIIPHQTNPAGSLMILETVTDKNGRFYFPAWGPKWHLGSGDLTDSDPELLFFKSGYKYIRVSNSQYIRPIKYRDEGRPVGAETKLTGAKRSSLWSGETIKMERFKGALKEYSSHLDDLKGSLGFIREECNWEKTPVILIALDKERQIFRANKIDSGTYSLDDFDRLSDNQIKKCGSPSEFFKGQKR